MKTALLWFLLFPTMSSASTDGPRKATPDEIEKVMKKVATEQWGRCLSDHLYVLNLQNRKTRGAFLVPIMNTRLEPQQLNVYLLFPDGQYHVLPSPIGSEWDQLVVTNLDSIAFEDKNRDGLTDLVFRLRVRKKTEDKVFEKTTILYNDGAAGFHGKASGNTAEARKTIAVDCQPYTLGKDLSIQCCRTSSGELEIKLSTKAGVIGPIKTKIDSNRFPRQVEVEGWDSRAIAIVHEDVECDVVRVIRLKDGKVLGDTGCGNSAYCSVKHFPDAKECGVSVECGEGGGVTMKKNFDVCGGKKGEGSRPAK